MVTRINASLPAAINQSPSPIIPLIAVLAFAALACLLIQVTKCRVQPMVDPNKLHRDGLADLQNELYEEAVKKFTVALGCKLDLDLRVRILMDRAGVYGKTEEYDKATKDLVSALECRRSKLQYESFNKSIRDLLEPTIR